MKNKMLVMLIAVVSLVCLAQAEVQDNYGMSQTQIARDSYNSTYGAGQIIILGQIATTPQDNYGDSLTQIARKKYNQTYGADQVVISTSAGKQLPFTNLSGVAEGDFLYYSASGVEWVNTNALYMDTGVLKFQPYTRSLVVPANASVLGPTAPGAVTVGTYRGFGFDADAEQAFLTFEVPDDWDGASDMTLKIYWTNEPADALANTETVKYDMSYRVTDHTEDLDAGTAATGTVTYTQSGAGTDGTLQESTITLDYDNANQPLVVDHVVGILFDRDMTGDTYTGDAVVIQWEVDYTSVSIPKHD